MCRAEASSDFVSGVASAGRKETCRFPPRVTLWTFGLATADAGRSAIAAEHVIKEAEWKKFGNLNVLPY